jgi:D-alanine transaminase
VADILYFNGRFTTTDERVISVEDRGFLFADGIYEVFKFLSKRPILLHDHFRRLQRNLQEIEIGNPWTESTFASTMTELLARSECTDGIVYIQVTRDLPVGLDGRLAFMTSVGPLRYLHAQVRDGLAIDLLLSTAAHELQHALEVAAHEDVRDAGGLASLYERIGIPGHEHNRYDTAAARITGRRVRQELS